MLKSEERGGVEIERAFSREREGLFILERSAMVR